MWVGNNVLINVFLINVFIELPQGVCSRTELPEETYAASARKPDLVCATKTIVLLDLICANRSRRELTTKCCLALELRLAERIFTVTTRDFEADSDVQRCVYRQRMLA